MAFFEEGLLVVVVFWRFDSGGLSGILRDCS